jgi:hypothetical protein
MMKSLPGRSSCGSIKGHLRSCMKSSSGRRPEEERLHSVRFHDGVMVFLIDDLVTLEEAKDVWYNKADYAAFQKGSKHQAQLFFAAARKREQASGAGAGPNLTDGSISTMGDEDFRGCEVYNPARTRHKSASIRLILDAYQRQKAAEAAVAGSSDEKLRELCKLPTDELVAQVANACAFWSTAVAFFQAYHDHAHVYRPSLVPYIPKLLAEPPPEDPFRVVSG